MFYKDGCFVVEVMGKDGAFEEKILKKAPLVYALSQRCKSSLDRDKGCVGVVHSNSAYQWLP